MTADALRAFVVRTVVLAIVALTFLLYVLVAVLVLRDRGVPDVISLAAGNASGALFALLVNSKATPEVPIPVYEAEAPVGAE